MMKSCPRHSRKRPAFLLKITLAVLLLITVAGCSNGGDQLETDQPEVNVEMEQLTAENEKLRADLDDAISNLKEAEAKVKELENVLEAIQEAQAEPSPSVPVKVDITPPERTPRELLIGQWFYQGFHEEGLFSFTQTLVFNMDGTGTMSRRYYIPKSEVEAVKSSPSALPDLDSSVGCSWSLSGDTVHIVLGNGEAADFTYSAEQQQLQMKGGNDKYGKGMPSVMEQYVERALYAENLQAKEAARMRRFLGLWYLDVLTWTFNEDGTGVIDMPELGDQPATTREFTYSVTDDPTDDTYLCLMLDWEDGDTSYFYPEFDTDGSMSLKGFDSSEVMKLTRTFDIDNCPISEQIISAGMGVFSGSIFSDILGGD
ncbi:MAG: DUF4315 family protein [Oscillospiraceae bacterium]|nr:DUF4315 family protein [Oscillospiraceae bacterium]